MKGYSLSPFRKAIQVASALLPSLVTLLALSLGLPRGILLLFALAALGSLRELWSIPLEMTLREDGALELRAALRIWVIFASEIRSINAAGWNGAYVTIRHDSGRIHLVRRMKGMGDLVDRLMTRNPRIRTKFPFHGTL
jgi:hypothetical protein